METAKASPQKNRYVAYNSRIVKSIEIDYVKMEHSRDTGKTERVQYNEKYSSDALPVGVDDVRVIFTDAGESSPADAAVKITYNKDGKTTRKRIVPFQNVNEIIVESLPASEAEDD